MDVHAWLHLPIWNGQRKSLLCRHFVAMALLLLTVTIVPGGISYLHSSFQHRSKSTWQTLSFYRWLRLIELLSVKEVINPHMDSCDTNRQATYFYMLHMKKPKARGPVCNCLVIPWLSLQWNHKEPTISLPYWLKPCLSLLTPNYLKPGGLLYLLGPSPLSRAVSFSSWILIPAFPLTAHPASILTLQTTLNIAARIILFSFFLLF